ncbi:MAG: hypothetical protein Q9178_001936 [Gyalolechia marmorata]
MGGDFEMAHFVPLYGVGVNLMEGNQYHPRIVASSKDPDPDPDGRKGADSTSTSIDQDHRSLGSAYFKSAQWYRCSMIIVKTTEEYIAPHSLLFSSHDPKTFFAGSLNLISIFDINRNGEGPVERMPTVPSKRTKIVGGIGGVKGIVSALNMSSEGILAAGTFSRWIGLYDAYGRGGSLGAFELQGNISGRQEGIAGTGVTQVLWSADGRYLCVVERCSDCIGIWDVRGTGKKLACMKGRKADTNQRMGVEVVGDELWAGGVDGTVRVWHGLGKTEGLLDPTWEFKAHDGMEFIPL